MKECINCRKFNNGYCKLKKFNVSLNANWCKDYKLPLIKRVFKFLNGNTVKPVNDWSELENSRLDTPLTSWDQDNKPDDTNHE